MHEIKKNKELVQQNYYIDKNARLMERENISRNIHNSVGHSITAAIMTLDAADMLFDKNPEEAHKRMNDAAVRIRGSLESIRSAVRALDTEDEDVSVKDMMCYTDNIIDEFVMDTELSCDRIYDMYSEDVLLPKEQVEFLTGALSELLTNGVKHGGATAFSVKLSGDSAHIRLEVRDNGNSSFSEETRDELIHKGFGLKKLMSYAERCGGFTEFRNDSGFFSMIELPLGE
jgi:signal transduction histidine kinase